MKYVPLITLVLLATGPAYAGEMPSSLFFTADESKTIADLVAKEARPDDPSLLRLDALFYYGSEDWVFWLGTQRWTPGFDQPRLHVVSVAPDEVHLTLLDDAAAPREITLKPHQSYRTATGEIRESGQ